MTNEEIKKKIVEVLKETINWATDYSIPIGIVYKSELDEIADALIAAGIGDVKELQLDKKAYEAASNHYRILFEEAQRRAEIAERMFDLEGRHD